MAFRGRTGGTGQPVSVQGEEKMFKDLDNILPTKEEKTKIVESSVPMLENHLRDNTPYLEHKFPSQRKVFNQERDPEHLKKSITHKPGQTVTGGTNVGYSQQASPIARWVNWGTYRQGPQFFFEHSFDTFDKDKFFGLQAQTAKAIVKAKGTYTE